MNMIFFLTGIVLFMPFESLQEGECTLVGKVYRVTDTSVRITHVKALEEGSWKLKSGEFYCILPDNSNVEEDEYLAVKGVNSKLGNLNFIRAFFSGDYFSYRYLPSAYERTRAFFQSFSNSFVSFLKDTVGNENGSIASAVFLGTGLDGKTRDLINKAGISYLFVVSGFHFFLVYFLFTWVISFFRTSRTVGFILKTTFLCVFFMICSTGPSSYRAFLMLFIYELFKYIDYPVSPLSVLGISGIIILLEDAPMALNAGFQMTYGAVLGILLFSELLKDKGLLLKYLIPLGSLLFIIPITASNFNMIPFLAVPFGLFISLTLIPFTMLCLFIIIILYALQLPFFATLFLKGLNPLLTASRSIVEFLANGLGTIAVGDLMAVIILVVSLVFILLLTILILRKRRKLHFVKLLND